MVQHLFQDGIWGENQVIWCQGEWYMAIPQMVRSAENIEGLPSSYPEYGFCLSFHPNPAVFLCRRQVIPCVQHGSTRECQ
jgi:hypothetical protein